MHRLSVLGIVFRSAPAVLTMISAAAHVSAGQPTVELELLTEERL